MKIIGICGTNGSGKDTVGDMLAERYGFLFISVSDLLRQECKKRGLAIERKNLRDISAQWRRDFGLGVLVDKAIEEAKNKGFDRLAVVPMRNVGEAKYVQKLGGQLVWVDASPKIRYNRIASRSRSAEDNKTFVEFVSEEKAEMSRPKGGDEATLDLLGVKDICNIFIENNGNDIELFKNQAEEILTSHKII